MVAGRGATPPHAAETPPGISQLTTEVMMLGFGLADLLFVAVIILLMALIRGDCGT